MHLAEQGRGPLVLLCHGFPESWYSWRHQLPALAAAGYRAVAPDMRGYGGTDRPEPVEQYTQLHLVGDMVGVLDALGEETAVIVGHDWGASGGLARGAAPARPLPGRRRPERALRAPRAHAAHPRARRRGGRPLHVHALLPDARRGRGRAGGGRPRLAAPPPLLGVGRRRARRGLAPGAPRELAAARRDHGSRDAAPLAHRGRSRVLRRRVRAHRVPGRPQLVPEPGPHVGADGGVRQGEGHAARPSSSPATGTWSSR